MIVRRSVLLGAAASCVAYPCIDKLGGDSALSQEAVVAKRPYKAPVLERWGSLTDITRTGRSSFSDLKKVQTTT